eukprot:469015-Prorocentrum_minimum.AAC.1
MQCTAAIPSPRVGSLGDASRRGSRLVRSPGEAGQRQAKESLFLIIYCPVQRKCSTSDSHFPLALMSFISYHWYLTGVLAAIGDPYGAVPL